MSSERNLETVEWQFLLAFFESLADAGIISPVLRNYDSLPNSIGNDLDVFIPRLRLRQAEKIFCILVAAHGGQLIKKFKKDTFTAWWVRIGDAPLLHVDLFNGAFFWRGRRFVSDDAVIKSACSHQLGFTVPRPALQAFSMFVTSLIWGGFYQQKYGAEIISLLDDDDERAYFDKMIGYNFGEAQKVPFSFENTPSREEARDYSNKLRKGVRWRWLRKLKLIEFFCVGRYWLWEVINLLKPSGGWLIAKEDESLQDILSSELMKTYGGATEMNYCGYSLFSWLWFRLRYVQRRMARNELVVVRVNEAIISKILNRSLGLPTVILNGAWVLESVVLKKYYKKTELGTTLWCKTSAKHRF